MVAGLLQPDAGTIAIAGIDALADPVAAKKVTAWVSDEPMIYDKLTPFEYLEFVAGLWGIEPAAPRPRADELIGWLGLAPHAHERCEGFSQGHAPEGGAGRRAGARSAADHPRRAADRARRRLGAAGQGRAARAGRAPAAPSS